MLRSPSWTFCSSWVSAADIFYSNPVKSRDQIPTPPRKASVVRDDSVEELRKDPIDQGTQLYLRVDTPISAATWPLAGKFGAHASEVPTLSDGGEAQGRSRASPFTWARSAAIRELARRHRKSRAVFRQMGQSGPQSAASEHRRGFPVRHVKRSPRSR